LLALSFLALVIGASLFDFSPWWLPAVYVLMGVPVFAIYAHAKSIARANAAAGRAELGSGPRRCLFGDPGCSTTGTGRSRGFRQACGSSVQ